MKGINHQDVEVNIKIEGVIKWQDFQIYESCYTFSFIHCKKVNVRKQIRIEPKN